MPPTSPPARIPSLDGLRAVSIALVVVGHLFIAATGRNPTSADPLAMVLGNGYLGVSIFFVISGYLITSLLVREFDGTGRISLPAFYRRRAYRILPAFVVYLATLAVLGAVGVLAIDPHGLLRSALFLFDYWPVNDAWYVGHTWSLSVEEQFYLLWPFALAARGRRRAATLALAIIVSAPAVRVLTQLVFERPGFSSWALHTRADHLMFGCVAALLTGDATFERARRWLAPLLPMLVAFVAVGSPLLAERFHGYYTYLVGYSIDGLTIMVAMLWVRDHPTSWIGRILNARPLVVVGVSSYSLYLWQQVFINHASQWALSGFPVNLLCACAAAALSYRFVEQPLLRLRARRGRRTTARPHVVLAD